MTRQGSTAPAPSRFTSADWWFRSADGELVLGQAPNPAILVWFGALVVGWFDLFPSHEDTVAGVRLGALLVWALDELLRGASPFRRALGAGVLVFQAVALLLS